MLLLTILLTTTSCSWLTPPKADPLPLNVAGFYQVGRTWTYAETTNGATETTVYTKHVVDQSQYHGQTAWQIVTTLPDNPLLMREYLAFDASVGSVLGMELVDATTQTVYDYSYLPGVRFSALLVPGSPLVSSYTTIEDEIHTQWQVESQILSTNREHIIVPAGEFADALRVRTRVITTRSTIEPPASHTVTVNEDTWYVPDVGVVKSQATDGSYEAVLIDYAP